MPILTYFKKKENFWPFLGSSQFLGPKRSFAQEMVKITEKRIL
jgi:hypothetical protein